MTISVLQVIDNPSGSGAAITKNITLAAPGFIDIYIAQQPYTVTVSSVTVGINACTSRDNVPDSSFNWRAQHFTSGALAAGTYAVTANFSGATTSCAMLLAAIGGSSGFINSIGQLQTAPGNSADAVTSGALGVLPGQPALILGMAFQSATTAVISAGTGYSSNGNFWTAQHANCVLVENEVVVSTASVPATFTIATSNHMITIASAWLQSGGGGGSDSSLLSVSSNQGGF